MEVTLLVIVGMIVVPLPQVHVYDISQAPGITAAMHFEASVLLRALMGSATCSFQCQLPIWAPLLAQEKAPFKYLKQMTCADICKVLFRGDIKKRIKLASHGKYRRLLPTLMALVALAPGECSG